MRPWTPERPAVVVTAGRLEELPYDVWQAGQHVRLSVPEFFPRLAPPVVRVLTSAQRERLYEAPQPATTLGRRTSEAFVLRTVFDAEFETLRRPAALVAWLNGYHAQAEPMAEMFAQRVLTALAGEPAFAGWELPLLLTDAEAFAAFVHSQWRGFLQQETGSLIAEESVPYLLDFAGDQGLQDGVGRLVRTGAIEPVGVDGPERLPPWARAGVLATTEDARQRRRAELLAELQERLVTDADGWRWLDWQVVARAWAELSALTPAFGHPSPNPGRRDGRRIEDPASDGRAGAAVGSPSPNRWERGLGDESRFAAALDTRFLAWLTKNYAPLAVQKVPTPHHVHHVPHWLAFELRQRRAERVALLILDGMSLADWVMIGSAWRARHPDWRVEERLVLAQLPTITAISRQALVSGLRPADFADSIGTYAREPALWARFWAVEGLPDDANAFERLALDRMEPPAPPAGRIRALCVVESSIDEIVHGASLGAADVQASLRLWLDQTSPRLEGMIEDLLSSGFVVTIGSDHGHVEARGLGQPSEGLAVQTRGRRARIYRDRALAERALAAVSGTMLWGDDGLLPGDVWALIPDGRTAFAPEADTVVTHGGPTLDEMVVPFASIALR